jgi:hypothetical protein
MQVYPVLRRKEELCSSYKKMRKLEHTVLYREKIYGSVFRVLQTVATVRNGTTNYSIFSFPRPAITYRISCQFHVENFCGKISLGKLQFSLHFLWIVSTTLQGVIRKLWFSKVFNVLAV